MKSLLTMTLLLFCSSIYSQKNSQYIISADGDTIKDIHLCQKPKFTNLNIVCYTNCEGKSVKSNASELKKYFNGNQMFYSYPLKSGDRNVLVTYDVLGELIFAYGKNKRGEFEYYVIKDDTAHNTQEYKNDLKKFFYEIVDINNDFKANKKIFYDYKSLGEFVTAYNIFRDPKKYKPVEYISPRRISAGVFINYQPGIIHFQSLGHDFIGSNSFSYGLLSDIKFNRIVSWQFMPYFERSRFAAPEAWIRINSFNLETAYTFSLFQKGSKVFRIGPAIGLRTLFYSYITDLEYGQFEFDNLHINNFRLLYGINSFFDMNSFLLINAGLKYSSVKINDIHTVLKNPSGKIGKYTAFSIGLTYKFKSKDYFRSDKTEYKDYEDF